MAPPSTDCNVLGIEGRQVHDTDLAESCDSTSGIQPTNTHSFYLTASALLAVSHNTQLCPHSGHLVISSFWDGDEVIVDNGCSLCTCSGLFLTNIHSLLGEELVAYFLLCLTFSAELAFSSDQDSISNNIV